MIPDLTARSWGFQAQTQAFCRLRPIATKAFAGPGDDCTPFDGNAATYRTNHPDKAVPT
jgi:hypothetical protein